MMTKNSSLHQISTTFSGCSKLTKNAVHLVPLLDIFSISVLESYAERVLWTRYDNWT